LHVKHPPRLIHQLSVRFLESTTKVKDQNEDKAEVKNEY